MKRKHYWAALLLVSCAGAKDSVKPPPVWPLPPDPPRIQFVQSVASKADLGLPPGFLAYVRKVLFGVDSLPLLTKPFDVCAGYGKVYVTDPSEGRVAVFDFNTHTHAFLGQGGGVRLERPHGIAIGREGHVYVADRGLLRVVEFAADGSFLTAHGGKDQFVNPVGVAVDNVGRTRLYVADSYRHKVFAFDPDGQVVLTLGKQIEPPKDHAQNPPAGDEYWNRGAEPGEFNFPTYVAVDFEGFLYVVDSMNFRVQVFDASGAYQRAIGGLGRQFGSFSRPKGVAVDKEGHVYVADAAFNNVQIFNRQGEVLLFFGAIGHGPGEFWLPQGVAASEDMIYVVDQYNHRVQVFRSLPESPTS